MDLRNYNRATAFIYAATFGQEKIADLLLSRDADISVKYSRGNTAYDHAKMQGLTGLAEKLE